MFIVIPIIIMQIILSTRCRSLTGTISGKYGYAVQKRKSGFYGVRYSRGYVPPDGHWRFILNCAQLAHNGLYVARIELHWTELYDALYEAYYFVAADHVGWNGRNAVKLTYNAQDIINLKHTFGL